MKSPEKTIPELIEVSLQFIKSAETYFSGEKIIWCEVPPNRNLENDAELNEKTKLYNETMKQALVSPTCAEIMLEIFMSFSTNIPRMKATTNFEKRRFYNNQSSRVFLDTTSYRSPRT